MAKTHSVSKGGVASQGEITSLLQQLTHEVNLPKIGPDSVTAKRLAAVSNIGMDKARRYLDKQASTGRLKKVLAVDEEGHRVYMYVEAGT